MAGASNTPALAADQFSDPKSERSQPSDGWAIGDLGGYSRKNTQELEGRYVCFRPMFSNPAVINAYLINVYWDPKLSCLIFQEEGRADASHAQRGQVYIPEGKPFLNFVPMDKGALRLIMVSRPDHQGIARGLIMTLANPSGMHFTPASASVVLRRLSPDVSPKLGFVHPGSAEYNSYQEQLSSVFPNFGLFGETANIAGRDNK